MPFIRLSISESVLFSLIVLFWSQFNAKQVLIQARPCYLFGDEFGRFISWEILWSLSETFPELPIVTLRWGRIASLSHRSVIPADWRGKRLKEITADLRIRGNHGPLDTLLWLVMAFSFWDVYRMRHLKGVLPLDKSDWAWCSLTISSCHSHIFGKKVKQKNHFESLFPPNL